ncbi:Crp/Fnr family transcriptional regulator [Sphingobacterium sp. IITKGP-BTPF85]|uniref:Crp/Fnr family transcriptional regulator n=1 Tax=Sphingobacterium sp. IITKGP-BTPF85 TaxID=1338009 RepID=UPI00038A20B3|nr:Crp/Fnr family transcriptional regulator [Sphingobacterium sp. IITKGP-BTPF85]KKX52150.1 cyclic nucleotide-binding protein [Sphingobacterium sp. IITKGP-BTPF85]
MEQPHTEQLFVRLIDHFKQFFHLNNTEQEEIERLFTSRVIKRKQYLLQEGEVCQHYSFVVSGCFRMFAVDSNFREHNLQFAAEDDWITDFQSFYDQSPSKLYIEAIEPSTVLQIKHEDLLYLYINYHKFDRNFRIITERKLIDYQNRILQNISSTADDRYEAFLKQYPHLINRLPNTQIASYLGITSEFLSKIRKKVLVNSHLFILDLSSFQIIS